MNTKVILGILGGITVGAIAGIVFAPAKGKKTRKQIMKKSAEFTEDLKHKFENIYKDITNKYEKVIDDAKEFVSNSTEK